MISHITGKQILKVVLMLTMACGGLFAQSLTYYVSASVGSDKNDGLSADKPWATLTKVNAVTFQPGDKVLLKSGDKWAGQLILSGSGTEVSPIVVDLYGGTVKPIINGNGTTNGGTVYITNDDCIEVNNLEITNDANDSGAERRGVCVEATNYGTMHHIYLKNLYIHNVQGLVSTDDGNMAAKRSAAIGIHTTDDSKTATRFDNIWIDSCVIDSIQEIGIYTYNFVNGSAYPNTAEWIKKRITNLKITNNKFSNIAKNGMILRLLDGGLIEHNLLDSTSIQATGNTIFTASCDSTVFQFNEGAHNFAGGTGARDGSLYDADLRSCNIIFQYSYSHDNRHGLFWNCTLQADSNIVCRYNVSQNDQGIIFCTNYAVTSMYLYNNTVFIDSTISPIIISERNGGSSGTRTYYFYNNIIYNLSSSATYDIGTSGYTRIFDSNVFYGKHPANEPTDSNKITTNPLLVNPGSATYGLASLTGYKLQSNSPCINSGVRYFEHPLQDAWDIPIPIETAPDRGASEYSLTTGQLDKNDFHNRNFVLSQNYPNPFNPSTILSYTLNGDADIMLRIFNIQGNCVKTLKKGFEPSGNHSLDWNGRDEVGNHVSSGVYFACLESANNTAIIKMLLVK